MKTFVAFVLGVIIGACYCSKGNLNTENHPHMQAPTPHASSSGPPTLHL